MKLSRLIFPAALALALLASGASAAAAVSGGASAPGTAVKHGGSSRASRGPAPVLTSARCYRVGRTHCRHNHRAVQIGGELVIRGHHFAGRISVEFPRAGTTAAGVDPVAAALRPTRHGFAVTVPAGVASGRIYLENRAGERSNRYGPLKILPAPVVPVVDVTAGDSPFDGAGMWIWYLADSDGGNLAEIATQAKAAGIHTLFIKASDGPDNFWPQFNPTLVQTLHADGLDVCAWEYVYGQDPVGEAQMGAEAVADGADCLVIDAESQYEGQYWAAQTYIASLRASIGSAYPLGLTSFPYTNDHPSEPYSVFFGPDGAQYDLPQIYWKDLGASPDDAYATTYVENRIYNLPIVPIGQAYDSVPAAQITRFRQLVAAYGAVGFSLWSWQAATSSEWTALGAPLAAGDPVTVPSSWPQLEQGDSGDQVIWMQEHLLAAEPGTPTSGSFNKQTETNLLAFQRARGLSADGYTDAATWEALLALTPVEPVYPQPPPTGSTGSTGTTGSTGGSGASGTSGSSGSSGGTSP
ncbi:MAG TPA: peptidoglycan-binding domain-containing protein [Solirubrobacteraceae bacterium]|nr:peptidoglycan-binding domain-containing protein [Solirubrobacteraceae bacterium]